MTETSQEAGILEEWKCDICGDSFVWPHCMGIHKKYTHLVQVDLATAISRLNLAPHMRDIILKYVEANAKRKDNIINELARRLFDAEVKRQ